MTEVACTVSDILLLQGTGRIETKGGLHVFGRLSSVTLMTAKVVPLNVVQVLLRHKDVRCTLG